MYAEWWHEEVTGQPHLSNDLQVGRWAYVNQCTEHVVLLGRARG